MRNFAASKTSFVDPTKFLSLVGTKKNVGLLTGEQSNVLLAQAKTYISLQIICYLNKTVFSPEKTEQKMFIIIMVRIFLKSSILLGA